MTDAYHPPAGRQKSCAAGVSGMSNASTYPIGAWPAAANRRSFSSSSLGGDASYMLLLRFIAHLPYFKVAAMLALPQGISNGGLLAAALVNALACTVASRWCAGLRRGTAGFPHRAALPLLGTTAVFITLMLAVPALASAFPRHSEHAADFITLLPACLCLVAPVCAVFFAAQYLALPRAIAR